MAVSRKPRHAHRPRLIRIPMMTDLHNEFGLVLHTALAALASAPDREQFDAIAQIFNVVGIAIDRDLRFGDEARILAGGAAAMNQIDDGYRRTGALRPTALELAPVRNAVNVCDEILSRLDVTKLHLAQVRLARTRHVAGGEA